MRKYFGFVMLLLAVAILPVSCIGASKSDKPAETSVEVRVDGLRPDSKPIRAYERDSMEFKRDTSKHPKHPKHPGPKGPHPDSLRQKRSTPKQ